MIELRLGGGNERFHYRVAGLDLACDTRLPELEPFPSSRPIPETVPPASEAASGGEPPSWRDIVSGIRDSRGRGVAFRRDGRGAYELEVEEVGGFRIAAPGERIVFHAPHPRAVREAVVETALGPALIFALALRGVFCLHASAVEIGGRAQIFLGDSGAGKSTLAASLPDLLAGCRRLTDDVAPLVSTGGRLELRPRYPQLKHAPGAQPGAGRPEALPVHRVYLLEWQVSGREAEIEPLAGYAAALALVRHTVTSRLFDGALLSRHMRWCSRVAEVAAVGRLKMPKRLDALPGVAELIGRDRS